VTSGLSGTAGRARPALCPRPRPLAWHSLLRHRVHVSKATEMTPESNKNNPINILIDDEEYECLRKRILKKLNSKEELIFILREQNFTVKEISSIIDIKLIDIYLIKRENRKYIKERNRKIAQEEQEKIMAFNTIFESLSDEYKRTLIELYRLKNPDGSCVNERILQNDSNLKMKVSNICNQLNNTFFGIDLIHERNSIGSTIVLIEKEFYLVLEKKSKTFVM
jgi:hypothetical protein